MATFERHAECTWQGGLMDGNGEAAAGTGAFTLPVTFASRIQEPAGRTSPEELMAAAHAACYAMALNATLGRKKASADRTVVTATISADLGEGITIRASRLSVTVFGLKGMEPSQFEGVAQEAERNCPVSNAYRGSLQISLEAKVG